MVCRLATVSLNPKRSSTRVYGLPGVVRGVFAACIREAPATVAAEAAPVNDIMKDDAGAIADLGDFPIQIQTARFYLTAAPDAPEQMSRAFSLVRGSKAIAS